ncbi:MAG: tetratricopeptide repeat protein [Chthonomonadales bacterium]
MNQNTQNTGPSSPPENAPQASPSAPNITPSLCIHLAAVQLLLALVVLLSKMNGLQQLCGVIIMGILALASLATFVKLAAPHATPAVLPTRQSYAPTDRRLSHGLGMATAAEPELSEDAALSLIADLEDQLDRLRRLPFGVVMDFDEERFIYTLVKLKTAVKSLVAGRTPAPAAPERASSPLPEAVGVGSPASSPTTHGHTIPEPVPMEDRADLPERNGSFPEDVLTAGQAAPPSLPIASEAPVPGGTGHLAPPTGEEYPAWPDAEAPAAPGTAEEPSHAMYHEEEPGTPSFPVAPVGGPEPEQPVSAPPQPPAEGPLEAAEAPGPEPSIQHPVEPDLRTPMAVTGTEAIAEARRALRRGDVEAAIALLQNVEPADSASAEASELLGIALYHSGDQEGALDALQRAVAHDPRRASAHYNLAVVLKTAGDIHSARLHADLALDLKPDYAAARQLREQLVDAVSRSSPPATSASRAAAQDPHGSAAHP